MPGFWEADDRVEAGEETDYREKGKGPVDANELADGREPLHLHEVAQFCADVRER